MDKQNNDPTTFQIFQKGKDPQFFTDPRQAGAAWYTAEMSEKSVITVQKGSGPARVYAQVSKEGAEHVKNLPFENMPGAADFKASFKDALERHKTERAGTAAGKAAESQSLSKPMDMPAIRSAERGHTYEGKIVGFQNNKVIQAVSEGQKTYHVAHERAALSSAKAGMLQTGKDLSIRYPYAGVGIVQERQLERERNTPALQPKTLAGKGF